MGYTIIQFVQKLNKINGKRVLEFHVQWDIILNKNGKSDRYHISDNKFRTVSTC